MMKRYSDHELDEFKTIIQTKLDQAQTELSRLRAEIMDAQPNTKSFEDSAEQTLKDELSIMAGRQEKLVGSLLAALSRIGSKTYGVCTVTGELIPKERLKVVPHTTMCIEAKRRDK